MKGSIAVLGPDLLHFVYWSSKVFLGFLPTYHGVGWLRFYRQMFKSFQHHPFAGIPRIVRKPPTSTKLLDALFLMHLET